ncbi:pyrroline-5-carboxylate reductase [Luteolibacter sp. LG18]|nr:pyrroline-5-carboxylate reductase [Luteolibacter sp. LG18]
MGTALVEGALKAGAVSAADITGCDPVQAALDAFTQATGAATAADAAAIGASCDTILLATKPHDVAAALKLAAKGANGQPRLVISIAAGLTLTTLEGSAPDTFRIIRTMPNTPAMVGQGATAFCRGTHATPADAETALRLLSAVGHAIEVPERLMNAVTGLSGSGPAYVYLIIEALADGGVKAGLGRADSIKLAAQTVLGAAAMVMETGLHPAVLKDMVTSPGGTTIAALAEMEKHGVRAAMIGAVDAAVRRAAELGGS